MNKATPKCLSGKTGTIHRILFGMLAAVLLTPYPASAGAEDRYQYKVLFSPGSSQLQAEARGRVMIYDGLDNAVVERALDEQFNRIEHMLFVRTRHPGPDGAVSYDDDGCD